jgi:hypothetical protein
VIGEQAEAGLLLDFEVFAFEADLGVAERAEGRGRKGALAAVEVLVAPAVAVAPDGRGA